MVDKTDIIYDHYKDTFKIIQTKERIRNRLFIIVNAIIIIMLVVSIEPTESQAVISGYIKSKTESGLFLSFPLIQSCTWVVLLYVIVSHYQIAIYVEHLYSYLHNLESTIGTAIGSCFCRESGSYDRKSSLFIRIVHFLYTKAYHLLLMNATFYKFLCEWQDGFSYYYFDFVILIMIVFTLLVYNNTLVKDKKGTIIIK